MSNGTLIQQGRFTADGKDKTIELRAGVDWCEIYNLTQIGSAGAGQGIEYYWQRGMTDDTGIIKIKTAGTDATAAAALTSAGITYVDSSEDPTGALVSTITNVSAAAIPVVTNTGVNGLQAGDVVRLIDITGGTQISGVDFTVGNNTLSNTTFSLDYMAQIVAATTGSWRKIKYDPIFYPATRTITKVTKGTTTRVYFSVKHEFVVDSVITFRVADEYGMKELDGLQGKVTAIETTTDNYVDVNIDSSAFTTFAWPLTGTAPTTKPHAAPVGEGNTGVAAGKFDEAVRNRAYIGLLLAAGATSPAGALNDVIYWRAGRSLKVDNE